MSDIERLDLAGAKALLPLIRAIAAEVKDRRIELSRLHGLRNDLIHHSGKVSPEGFTVALEDLEQAARMEQRGLDRALRELERLQLEVRSIQPLVIHIPGRTSTGDVVFCWEEGKRQFGGSTTSEQPSSKIA